MVDAARQADQHAFADALQRADALVLTTTIEEPPSSERVSRAVLRNDFSLKSGYYTLLFDGAGEDAFADVFRTTGFSAWRSYDGRMFVPTGELYDDGRTFVRFDCLPTGATIVEIGWPAS